MIAADRRKESARGDEKNGEDDRDQMPAKNSGNVTGISRK
jgi:hypothetical protein